MREDGDNEMGRGRRERRRVEGEGIVEGRGFGEREKGRKGKLGKIGEKRKMDKEKEICRN